MTARERAIKALSKWELNTRDAGDLVDAIEQAIIAAIEEKGKTDAQIADDVAASYRLNAEKYQTDGVLNAQAFALDNRAAWVAEGIANRIRARSNPGPS